MSGFKKRANIPIVTAYFQVPTDVTRKQASQLSASQGLPSWYVPMPGSLLLSNRSISNRCNDNGDYFSAEQLKGAWKELLAHNDDYGYKTFIGKSSFLDHNNGPLDDPRGVIVHAALFEDEIGPNFTPRIANTEEEPTDVWVKLWREIDAVRYPRTAAAIKAGVITRSSMGCDIDESRCSICGNVARSRLEYCDHIRNSKMGKCFTIADGTRRLAYEENYGLVFFEDSLLTVPQADPTAGILEVMAHKTDINPLAIRQQGESIESWLERRKELVQSAYVSSFYVSAKDKEEEEEKDKAKDKEQSVDKKKKPKPPKDDEDKEDKDEDKEEDPESKDKEEAPEEDKAEQEEESEPAPPVVEEEPPAEEEEPVEEDPKDGDPNVTPDMGEFNPPPEEPTAMVDLKEPIACPANLLSINPEQCTGCKFNGATGQIVYCRFPDIQNGDGKDPTVFFETPNSLARLGEKCTVVGPLSLHKEALEITNGKFSLRVHGRGNSPRVVIVASKNGAESYYATYPGPVSASLLMDELNKPDFEEYAIKCLQQQAYNRKVAATIKTSKASKPEGGEPMERLVRNKRVADRKSAPRRRTSALRTYSSFIAGTKVSVRDGSTGSLKGKGQIVVDPKLGAIVQNVRDKDLYMHVREGNKAYYREPDGSMTFVGNIVMEAPQVIKPSAYTRVIRRRAAEENVKEKDLTKDQLPAPKSEDPIADEAEENPPSVEDEDLQKPGALKDKIWASMTLAQLKEKAGHIPAGTVMREARLLENSKSLKEIQAQIEVLQAVAPKGTMVPKRTAATRPVANLSKAASKNEGDHDDNVLFSLGM